MVKEISQKFEDTKFSTDVIQRAVKKLEGFKVKENKEGLSFRGKIELGDRTISHNDQSEYFRDYKKEVEDATAYFSVGNFENQKSLSIQYFRFNMESKFRVQVESHNRAEIEALLDIFEEEKENCRETFPNDPQNLPKVFIGHGRDGQWKDLKSHLSDLHKYDVLAYETGARAGHTIRDILEELSRGATIAFLLHTAEDEMDDGKSQARANVIHETGLFQGKLGFQRAIVLLEEGCEEFSNLAGIQQIRFSKGNIRETFGDVVATIKREFS